MTDLRDKSRIVRDPERRRLWLQGQSRCACCWARPVRDITLQAHHIIKAGHGGAGRSDEECNLLALCFRWGNGPRCHELAEGNRIQHPVGGYWPVLTLGMCLSLKLEASPEEWNPERLAQIRHRRLPDLETLPELLAYERTKWLRN